MDLTIPRRTSSATPVLKAAQTLRQFLIPIVVVIAFNSGDGLMRILTTVFATLLVAIVSTVSWLRLHWWVEDDKLRVRSGLLQIDDRTIPVARIQRVDRQQSLLARFFGVYELKAETAGGSGSELSLQWLTQGEADAVEGWLSHHRSAGTADTIETSAPKSELLGRVSLRDLVIAGATANRLGALAVIVASAFQLFDEITQNTFERLEGFFPSIAEQVSSGQGAAIAAVVLISLALVVGWVTSIVSTVIRHWEFTLENVDGDLKRSHGLLSRFEVASPSHRIQTIRIEQPLLRRLIDYASVVAETAGSPGAADGGAGVLLPITRTSEARQLAGTILEHDPEELVDLEHVSRLTIRRGAIRSFLRLTPLAAVAGWFTDLWIPVALATVLLAVWYGYANYRALGYRPAPEHIISRAGVLSRRTWSVPYAKVQTVAVRRSPFQRRLGLATVSIDTAGGRAPIAVIDIPTDTATDLAHMLTRRSTASLNADAV